MRSDEFQADSKQRKLQAKPALPLVKEVEGSKDCRWNTLSGKYGKSKCPYRHGNLVSADRALDPGQTAPDKTYSCRPSEIIEVVVRLINVAFNNTPALFVAH